MKQADVIVSDQANEIVYQYEKRKYQQDYHWTDAQFDVFWNNPELNHYLDRKNELIWIAQLGIDKGLNQ